jgi:hypothetical protein
MDELQISEKKKLCKLILFSLVLDKISRVKTKPNNNRNLPHVSPYKNSEFGIGIKVELQEDF